jgi:uncharacterized protein (TIGR02647 family)
LAASHPTLKHDEDAHLTFTPGTMEELNLLLQFDSSTLDRGIKVHSNARREVIAACKALFDRGLVNQPDGGYLTDAGIEALAHAQSLAGLLNANAPARAG